MRTVLTVGFSLTVDCSPLSCVLILIVVPVHHRLLKFSAYMPPQEEPHPASANSATRYLQTATTTVKLSNEILKEAQNFVGEYPVRTLQSV
jgi:hypothetical protein